LWDEAKDREREDAEEDAVQDKGQVQGQWTSERRVINLLMDNMHAATTRKDQLKAIGVFLTYLGNIPRFLATQVRFRTTLISELEIWRSWGLDERDVSRVKTLLVQAKRLYPDYVYAEGEQGETEEVSEAWASECRVINLLMDKIDTASSHEKKIKAAHVLLTYFTCIPAFLSANPAFRLTLSQTMENWRSDGLDQVSINEMNTFMEGLAIRLDYVA
jgi:hypothetical protein